MGVKKNIIIIIYTASDEYKYEGLRLMEVLVRFSERRLLSEIVRIEVRK